MRLAIAVGVILVVGLLAIIFQKRQRPDLSERCARVLAATAKLSSTKITVSNSGPDVSVAGRQVHVRARIENRKRSREKYFVALAVDLFVDGVLQPLTFGAVGVGNTDQDAEDTAIAEWAQYVGIALFEALASDRDRGLPLDSFAAYAGLTGVRGAEVSLPEHMTRDLLEPLKTAAPLLNSTESEFHSISIMVTVQEGAVTGGECRVDGLISSEALTAVQGFPWPKTPAEYLLKQFYILRRR